jgi:hypothetical protein
MAPGRAPDKLDQAIAAAARPVVHLEAITLTLPTGRPAILQVPVDITDLEWLGLIGVLPQVRDSMAERRAPAPMPRILVPS